MSDDDTKGPDMTDTVSVLGPELLRRIAEVHEQLDEAIAGLEEAVRAITPADTKTKLSVAVGMQRSIEMLEQAIDHLDIASRVGAGEAEAD
jgi:hypothetical protein